MQANSSVGFQVSLFVPFTYCHHRSVLHYSVKNTDLYIPRAVKSIKMRGVQSTLVILLVLVLSIANSFSFSRELSGLSRSHLLSTRSLMPHTSSARMMSSEGLTSYRIYQVLSLTFFHSQFLTVLTLLRRH